MYQNEHDEQWKHEYVGSTATCNRRRFYQITPHPNIVTADTTLNAQATSANINGSTISVLGYQANGILGPTIRVESGLNTNINFQNNLSESSN